MHIKKVLFDSVKYYNNPQELFDRLNILAATGKAGNTSPAVKKRSK